MVKPSILVIDKPKGMTSHDVVAAIRRLTGIRKVGHTGTLDPAATGVLILCLGQAVRVSSLLQGQNKRYLARVKFGISTDSYDSDGSIVKKAPCHVTEADVAGILPRFIGKIEQTPPMVSAISINGKRLHKLARQGLDVERPTRKVEIYSIAIRAFVSGEYPEAELDIECSKGTYIRSLSHDMGETLGCGAHIASLSRTANGSFVISEAHSLEDVERAWSRDDFESLLISVDDALDFLETVELRGEGVGAIRNGRHLEADMTENDKLPEGIFKVRARKQLLAIYRKEKTEEIGRAEVVFV